MRKLVVSVVTLAMCSLASQAALTVLEDFEALTVGTIDMQHEIDEWGYPIELWNAQANRAERYDSTWSTVEATGGMSDSKCLKMINRDRGGEIDTVYTTMYLGYDNRITDKGTIYMQYKASDANDCIVGFNDNFAGYPSDVAGDSIEDDTYQGTTNYAQQSALVRLVADQNFRARADNAYLEVDMGLTSDTWIELWVQFDVPNKTTRYYVCEAGGTPAVVINPTTSGEWWGWRDDTNASVDNIKFMFGGTGDFEYEVTMLIDNIAIEQDWTTESLAACTLQSDINGDGIVNIYDFLLLRASYGQTVPAGTPEDINDDGIVNIYDFLILRSEYGMSCN